MKLEDVQENATSLVKSMTWLNSNAPANPRAFAVAVVLLASIWSGISQNTMDFADDTHTNHFALYKYINMIAPHVDSSKIKPILKRLSRPTARPETKALEEAVRRDELYLESLAIKSLGVSEGIDEAMSIHAKAIAGKFSTLQISNSFAAACVYAAHRSGGLATTLDELLGKINPDVKPRVAPKSVLKHYRDIVSELQLQVAPISEKQRFSELRIETTLKQTEYSSEKAIETYDAMKAKGVSDEKDERVLAAASLLFSAVMTDPRRVRGFSDKISMYLGIPVQELMEKYISILNSLRVV
jgi:transcription initiation factor TFIIIB Brf1 subunit/transcription initiation factor TFIIB